MHSSLVEKFSKLVKEHACILEPIISVEDAHPYTKKQVNQLTIKQYYDGNEYCVRLDKFEKGVVEKIKAIDGAYYLAHGGWWIIDSKFYDPLIKQIKVRYPQIKINDQLDNGNAIKFYYKRSIFVNRIFHFQYFFNLYKTILINQKKKNERDRKS